MTESNNQTHEVADATIDCAGLTDIGRMRETNEDQFLIAELSKSLLVEQTSLAIDDRTMLTARRRGKLLMVADGMGGHAAGDRASQLAVETITRYTLNMMPWFFRLTQHHEDDLSAELKAALMKCQTALQQESIRAPETRGMGTTLTLAYIVWPRLFVVHAGDSRCYLFRQNTLSQLTRDHTVAQRLVDRGAMREDEAAASRYADVLTNVIDSSESSELDPDVQRVRLVPGDCLLLCSDGLTKHVSDQAIAGILAQQRPPHDTARWLVHAALEGGGSDNVTVAVARVHEQSPGD